MFAVKSNIIAIIFRHDWILIFVYLRLLLLWYKNFQNIQAHTLFGVQCSMAKHIINHFLLNQNTDFSKWKHQQCMVPSNKGKGSFENTWEQIKSGVSETKSYDLFFCGSRGFCHRTESDLFLFLFCITPNNALTEGIFIYYTSTSTVFPRGDHIYHVIP